MKSNSPMIDCLKRFSRAASGSIRRRLMVWGLILLGSALTLNTMAGFMYTRWQIQHASAELQKEIASVTARRIRSFIERKRERLQDAAVVMSLHALGGQEQRVLGFSLLGNDPSLTEFAILDRNGNKLMRSSEQSLFENSGIDLKRDSPDFRKLMEGEFYVSPVRSSPQGEPYVILAVPLRTGADSMAGALMAKANLSFLWDVVRESTFGKGGYAYIVDQRGHLIGHQDYGVVLKGSSVANVPKVRRFLQTRSQDPWPAELANGLSGKPVLSSYVLMPEFGWAVIVEEPIESAQADLAMIRRYAFLLVGLGLIIGAAIIVWVSRKITKPIQELRQGAAIIGAGKLEHRTNIETGDEIESLALQRSAAHQSSFGQRGHA